VQELEMLAAIHSHFLRLTESMDIFLGYSPKFPMYFPLIKPITIHSNPQRFSDISYPSILREGIK